MNEIFLMMMMMKFCRVTVMTMMTMMMKFCRVTVGARSQWQTLDQELTLLSEP